MKILITNDDGVLAQGISALARAVVDRGDVEMVAPDRERSACGHSMTMADPLRMKDVSELPVPAFSVNGVPVDCVNIGLNVIFPGGCDLVLSGFNHGANLGFDITYSGTVAGAMEGCINGIPSIALSMASMGEFSGHYFETGVLWVSENFDWLMNLPKVERSFLNINIPAVPFDQIKGVKFTKMGGRVYEDRVEMKLDPWGNRYFWQGGPMIKGIPEPETDFLAVSEGYVSITPLGLDWTHSESLRLLSDCCQSTV